VNVRYNLSMVTVADLAILAQHVGRMSHLCREQDDRPSVCNVCEL